MSITDERKKAVDFSTPYFDAGLVLVIKKMLPTITNQSIISLKDTSLLSVIGIADLTQQGQIQAAATFEVFKIWLIVGVIYFIFIYLLTLLSNFFERRLVLR